MDRLDDKPITRQAGSFADFMVVVTHPAFRIGFLDAQRDRACNHDDILGRIVAETPPNALKRLKFDIDAASVSVAQYRYEEGRLAVLEYGLSCRAWGHPDFPPKKLIDYIWQRVDELPRRPTDLLPSGSIVAALRGDAPPLLRRMLA